MSKIEKNLNSLNIPKVSDLRKQEDNKKNLDFLKLLVKSGAIVIILAAIANGIFRDGITLWTPSFLHERFGSGVAISVLSTLILPCFAIAGPVFAHAVNRHITNPLYATSIFFFLSLAAAFGVTILAKSYLLATVFFGIITCSMSAVNTLIVSVIPLSFRSFSNMSASLAGLTNAFCYIGSTSASYAFGAIARYYDWDGVLYALLIIAVIVAFLCIIGGLQYHKVFFRFSQEKMQKLQL
jgi:OPA family glycerol-3-phosphate transporter-like MFS transporter